MDPYLEEYEKLQLIKLIEVGWGSNVAGVRKAFPDATLDLMVNICDLQHKSYTRLRETVAGKIQQAAPISAMMLILNSRAFSQTQVADPPWRVCATAFLGKALARQPLINC